LQLFDREVRHDPVILTLLLDPDSQAFFERARQRWFPASRNLIPAHVTLFHHLPGEQLAALRAQIAVRCAERQQTPFSVTGVRFLGRGVAYRLQMPEIAALRKALAQHWAGMLTAQDRQPWQPHVTVQNKVLPREAKELYEKLAKDFVPCEGTVQGIALWHYKGGPWESAGNAFFSDR
jgi:2'-5' RNA ligase